MKEYELLIVLKPHIDSEETGKIIDKFEENITQFGGKINSTDKIGRKKLSYEIQKFRDGFYIVQKIELPENKVAELKRQLKLNENVIRYMLVKANRVAA